MADEPVDSEERLFRRHYYTSKRPAAGSRERPKTTIKIPISIFQSRMNYQTLWVNLKTKTVTPGKVFRSVKDNWIRLDNKFKTVNICVTRFFLWKRRLDRNEISLLGKNTPIPIRINANVRDEWALSVMELVGYAGNF